MLWRKFTNAIVEKTLRFNKGAQIQAVASDGTTSTIDLAELAAIDSIAAADLAKIDGITNGAAAAGKALVLDTNKAVGDIAQINVLGAGAVATNQALGATALDANTTGARNVAVGAGALSANTVGVDNTALGKDALLVATIGTGNTAVGSLAMDAATTGVNNTAVGLNALGAATIATLSVAIGKDALLVTTTGIQNVAVGALALDASSAQDCTAVGYNSLGAATSGAQNTALGSGAGVSATTGANNTCVGYGADVSAAGISNEVTLGNASVTNLRCAVTTINAISDIRDKTDIRPLGAGLQFINALRPISWTWNMRDGRPMPGDGASGFSAQDLLEVEQKFGNGEMVGIVNTDNPDRLEAAPIKMLPALIKAVQELSAEVESLKATRH